MVNCMNKEITMQISTSHKYLIFVETEEFILIETHNTMTYCHERLAHINKYNKVANECVYKIHSKYDIFSIIQRLIKIIKE